MTQHESIKGQYEESMSIPASAERIFDFVSDVQNLPKYLPTTKRAEPQSEDRVRVQGEVMGHHYDADGFLRADRDTMSLEWGADEHYYAGQLHIMPNGDSASNVTVRLTFRNPPPGANEHEGPSEADIRDGMRRALQSIENQVTGQGGKDEAPISR